MKVLDEYGLDYVVEKIYDAVNSGGSADYIVEQGTSDIWYYRKWASGIAECWGLKQYTVAIDRSWGGGYINQTALGGIAYPFTFAHVSDIQINVRGGNMWVMSDGGDSNSQLGYFWLYRTTTASSNTWNVYIHVVGRWKTFTPSVSRQGTTVKAWNFTAASGTTIHNNNVVVANGVVMGGLKFKFNASGSGWRALGTTTDKPNSTEAFPLINLSSGTWLGEMQVRADGTIEAYYVSAYANDAYVNLIYDIAD